MNFGFINNFQARLVRDLDESPYGASIYITESVEEIKKIVPRRYVALTLIKNDENGNEAQREIVYATGAGVASEVEGANFISIKRAQEGTEIQSFSAGDRVEARLTAGCFSFISDRGGIALGNPDIWMQHGAYSFVAIGKDVGDPGWGTVAVGAGTHAVNDRDVVIGSSAKTKLNNTLPPVMPSNPSNIAIGYHAEAGIRAALSVGSDATAKGFISAALGHGAVAFERMSQAVGGHSYAYGEGATGIGFGAVALAENSIALGAGAVATLPFGRKSTTMPYLSLEGFPRPDPLVKGYRMANDITYRQQMTAAILGVGATPQELINIPDEVNAALDTAGQISEQVVLGSTLMDLADANSTAAIVLPERAMVFVDSFDVVIMEADDPGGTPAIQISPHPGAPNTYLSNAAVTKQSVGGRNTFAPESADGTQMLFISLSAAGTGLLKAKIIVRGYIMEMGPLDQSGLGSHEVLTRTLPTPTGERWGWPGGDGSTD